MACCGTYNPFTTHQSIVLQTSQRLTGVWKSKWRWQSLSLPFLKRYHKEREREREMTVELQVPSPSWNSNGRLERTANTMSSRSFDIVKKPRLIDLFHMEGLPENHLEFLNMPLPISHDRFDSWISTLNSTCASVTCRLPQKIAG